LTAISICFKNTEILDPRSSIPDPRFLFFDLLEEKMSGDQAGGLIFQYPWFFLSRNDHFI